MLTLCPAFWGGVPVLSLTIASSASVLLYVDNVQTPALVRGFDCQTGSNLPGFRRLSNTTTVLHSFDEAPEAALLVNGHTCAWPLPYLEIRTY